MDQRQLQADPQRLGLLGRRLLLAATLDEDEGVMLGEQEPVLVEGLRSGLVVTLSRW